MNKRYQMILAALSVLLLVTAGATGIIVAFSYSREAKESSRVEQEAARAGQKKRSEDQARAEKEIDESAALKKARDEAKAEEARRQAEKRKKEEEQRKKEEEKQKKRLEEKKKREQEQRQAEDGEEDTLSAQIGTSGSGGSGSAGKSVCMDPGHQASGDSSQEPIGPGASETKARVTDGTTGVNGVAEYELNLTIGLLLQKELEKRGYTVYMTRTSHDVNISNKERAEFANEKGADITIRLHADADSGSASGATVLAPTSSNPYVSELASDSQRLGNCILDHYCSKTGFNNRGVTSGDDMTGINWCKMPVALLEMGFMDNASDDAKLEDSSLQPVMAEGIADGVDDYFGR